MALIRPLPADTIDIQFKQDVQFMGTDITVTGLTCKNLIITGFTVVTNADISTTNGTITKIASGRVVSAGVYENAWKIEGITSSSITLSSSGGNINGILITLD